MLLFYNMDFTENGNKLETDGSTEIMFTYPKK